MKHRTWIACVAPPTAARFNAIVGLVSLGIVLAGCGGPGQPGAGDGGRAGSGGAGGPIPRTLSLFAGGIGGPGTADGIGAAARFSGFQDTLSASPQGLATDGAGNLFVADRYGTIRKVVIATGAVTTLAGTPGLNNPQGLATDGAGNLFVADTGNSIILKVVIATGAVTTLAGTPRANGDSAVTDGTGPAATFFYPRGMACDNAGNLFVADGNTIRKVVIATGAVTTLAGTPGVFGSEDGAGPAATFTFASAMARDNAGNLFVADSPAIRKVVIATGVVTTLAEIGPRYDANGIGTAPFSVGLSSDGLGNLFVAVTFSHTIRKVAVATGVVTTIAGSLGGSGTTDGTGSAARFDILGGLANDGSGNLFVADNTTIRKIVIATGLVTTFAGASRAFGSVDGTGPAARFDYPTTVVNDGVGNLFVADTFNHTIRRVVIDTGAVTTLVGTAGVAGSDDGVGASAHLDTPLGLTSDGTGNLFVADLRTIRKVTIATGVVTTIERPPDMSAAALVTDGAGNLFVADAFYHAIRKVEIATGMVTTLAGSPGVSGNADGVGADARFNGPSGLTNDGAGSLFIGDSDNHTIRRVEIATGMVTTLVGSPGVTGSADGTGATARFYWPGVLASDGAGNLFVTDTGNSTIRRIVIGTGVVTTPVGSAGHAGIELGPLPAGLNNPAGLAIGPAGSLYISDENAILQVR